MTKTERILCAYTHRLFPQFNTPAFSRFASLFSELLEREIDTESERLAKIFPKEIEEDEQLLERYRINPKKIINGFEKRSSVIIKGIPADFGALNFYELLTKFCKEIKFFYIPGFAIAKWKYVYAFVTIGRRKGVLNIFEGLNMMKEKYKTFKGFDFSKIEVYFCKSQNIIGLTKKYQNEENQNNFIIYK